MIIVFDSDCLMCSAWVQFILRHDKQARFRFASMQGAAGRRLLLQAGLDADDLQTLLVVDGHGHSWQHTAAIFRVLHGLGWPWRLGWWAGWLIPSALRDPAYRLIARNRYRIFRRRNACQVLPPHQAQRFLD